MPTTWKLLRNLRISVHGSLLTRVATNSNTNTLTTFCLLLTVQQKETPLSRFFKDTLQFLEPYTPGEQPKVEGVIKLNTNENPYPPSPKVVAALAALNNETYDRDRKSVV